MTNFDYSDSEIVKHAREVMRSTVITQHTSTLHYEEASLMKAVASSCYGCDVLIYNSIWCKSCMGDENDE